MSVEAEYLNQILRCFVQNEKPGEFSGDWKELYRLAKINSVTGILGYMMLRYPDRAPDNMADFMRKLCGQTYVFMIKRAEKMQELIAKMNEEGIDHLLFKGYIVKDYYPIPALRTFGDVDFLIRPEDRAKSDALMMSMGFARSEDWEPVFSYKREIEYYEIHTDVMEVDVSDKADYKGYFKQVWQHAHKTGEHTWELSPEFHLLYLLTHTAKHISGSGAGIRMYMDIAVFIKHFRYNFDWDFFKAELEKLAFTDFVNMVFTVTEKYFEVKSPIELHPVDERTYNDFMEYTLSGGVFGYVGRDSGTIALKKENRNEKSVSRFKVFVKRLFPSAATIESRYTYLQGRHWLLPIAWIHRFFRTYRTWGRHAQEAKSIMNTDAEEVLKLKRIYKEIGL